ncbi:MULTISPECIES: CusA/CzcA family heavy metal efflux RND transporter [unclassified Empedobacter]|uniref:CusA/CzcA family heavy metal efflux RND transporter n=1 Tax=unclassified Empedobacter TaxID=2643773 RepID=UPI0025C22330|nr:MULTISPECIES: CusA/CzcA family heavy metal efflux RND transporter [unclassified Empedobacter]
MLNKIIDFSIKNKFIVGLFTVALLIFGIYDATKLPIDAQPDITSNQVQIITVAPSFSAEDIERLVTFPIEQANSNIGGISEIRSFSRFGLSLVTIVFDDETDVYWARQQVSERLLQVQNDIPEGIGEPQLGPISTGLGEIYQYVVRPAEGYEDQYDETELRTIQDWIVRRQLLGVPGVADVSSFGGKLKQYEIAINPQRLQSFNLTINDLFDALSENNQNTGGAYIEKGPTSLFIRSEGLIGKIEDIENILVKRSQSGTPILLKDVADVKTGFATRYGAMTYNDTGEVSGAVVMMLKGANSNEVVKNVQERIEEIKKTLPEGVIVEPFLDRKKMVDNTIRTVETNLLEGALIVVFILVIFLGNLRAGFIVASVIPLSLLFAIIMMNIFGVGGNLMSLGALDFGLIVDGAVIIVEAAMHQLAHNKKFGLKNKLMQTEMDQTVGSSAKKMVNSAVFGQIIILIVYLPIFTLQGIEGKMFRPMAQTVAFALIGAFILSLTYVPMMTSLFLSKKKKVKPNLSDRIMAKVEVFHQKYLMKALRVRNLILVVVFSLFAIAIFVMSRLGGEFIPALEEGDFAVEARVLPGSNLSTTKEYTTKAAKILKDEFPEVEMVVTKIGSGEIPTDPMPMDTGDMIVVLKPKKEWTSATTFPELSDKMSKALENIPGLSTGFQFPVQMRFNELMTGARQDVVVKIFGENLDSLSSNAAKLGKIINTVEGAQDLYIEPINGIPQVVIEFDRGLLAQYGLTVGEANRIINMAFAGQSTGMVFEGEKRFDLVVRLAEEKRTNIDDIRNLLIPTASGVQIPLNQLAKVDYKNTPNQIQREDAKRRIVVGFNVKGRDVESVVQELQQKVDEKIKFPTGYYATYGGAFENLNHAKARLGIAVPIALILIFILLYFAFKSVKESLLIYTAIPLSSIGGILFLAARDMPFSISAGVGFIALFGIAVLNGIVLISEYNRLRDNGIKNTTRIVIMGTRTRLRPVLMTAAVASLGFLPMALSNGSGAEVQRPLATVVIGGLMGATFLTLFVLPILYVMFENIHFKKKSTRHKSFPTAILLVLVLFGATANAQERMSFDEVVKLADANNLEIKQAELNTVYHEKNVFANRSLSPLDIAAEFGQVNSGEFDNKFTISQSFQFPVVFKRQKALNEQMISTSKANEQLTKVEVKQRLANLYVNMQNTEYQQDLLKENELIYQEFLKKANLRLKKGESNRSEVSTAIIQLKSIQNQLRLVENELENESRQIQFLTNSSFKIYPTKDGVNWNEIAGLSVSDAHPMLKLAEENIQTSTLETEIEKSKKIPVLTVGYSNQSFSDLDKNRYNSFQVGVGLPLFNRGINSSIEASKVKTDLARQAYTLQQSKLQQDFDVLKNKVNAYEEMVGDFEQSQLPAANDLQKTINRQLLEGEINFLDWVILNNQIIEVKTKFLEAKNLRNQAYAAMTFYTAQ